MKNLAVFSMCLGCVFAAAPGHAIDLKQSKVTQVVNDVQIISAANQTEKPAAVNDIFSMPDILRTGAASRAELVAQDQTVTRVGANTIFSFDPANRTIDLKQGSLLFHSPHGKGGGAIHTGSATASVLGTTLIITTTPNGGFKILALEGEVEVKFLNGLKQKLDPGQMTFVLPGANQLAPVIIFRLDELIQNSLLVKGFTQSLGSQPLIQNQIVKQLKLLHTGRLTDTGFYAGNNASPNQVEVLDVNTIAPVGNPVPVGANADAHITQPSLTDASIPTPPNHILSDATFALPINGYFADQRFDGFVARNIYVTPPPLNEFPLAVNLSPYSHLATFDIVAMHNFFITGPLQFSGLTAANNLELIAGNQFIFTPGITVGVAGNGGDDTVHNLVFTSAATMSLNEVTLYNLSGLNQNLSLNSGADVSIQNDSLVYAGGDLAVNAIGNISISAGLLDDQIPTPVHLLGNTMELTSSHGAITVDTSTLDAGNRGTFTAPNGITINNSVVNANAASGSLSLSSSSGSINITGTSIMAHYLTLNSGDGILLDASGQTLSGPIASGPGAAANLTAKNTATINNTDFSSFATMNVVAKTVVLVNDVLALITNIGCSSGQANFGSVVQGDANFINCRYQGSTVTSDSIDYSSGVVNSPGIHVHTN